MADYGQDVSTFPSFDTTGRSITGRRVFAEQLFRLLRSEAGSLRYCPETLDLRDYLEDDVDDVQLALLAARCEAIYADDERVRSARVEFIFDAQTETLRIRSFIVPIEGEELRFTATVDKFTTADFFLEDA